MPKLENIIITASIVFNELNKLKTDKSPGPKGWPLHIFKECLEQLSTPLSIFFNKSFQSGVLPSEWRIAFVNIPSIWILRGHSCTTQLLHVMDILTKSLDQGMLVDVIYMDLQKTFDIVPDKRLLYKLNTMEIRAIFSDGLLDYCLLGGSVLFKWKQFDILLSKNEVLQILYLKHHVYTS